MEQDLQDILNKVNEFNNKYKVVEIDMKIKQKLYNKTR